MQQQGHAQGPACIHRLLLLQQQQSCVHTHCAWNTNEIVPKTTFKAPLNPCWLYYSPGTGSSHIRTPPPPPLHNLTSCLQTAGLAAAEATKHHAPSLSTPSLKRSSGCSLQQQPTPRNGKTPQPRMLHHLNHLKPCSLGMAGASCSTLVMLLKIRNISSTRWQAV